MIHTVYIEKKIITHPRTKRILNKFAKARKIIIERYGEVFNKRSQNFRLQKLNPALILAHKYSGHILPAPSGFGIGGSKNFYFSHMLNCIYDCRYCFLQGMFSSANYVIFVNYEDFDSKINKLVGSYPEEKITFFSGYDCDSLAFENITGFAAHILPIFKKNKSAELEFRTKSTQIRHLMSIEPASNCIIAFSLTPEKISNMLDHKAPKIEQRLAAIKDLAENGWKIGLRFDPLIYAINWRQQYKFLFDQIFEVISEKSIHSISYGPLRFPKDMFKKITKLYPEEKIFAGMYKLKNGTFSYRHDIENEMREFCEFQFKKYVSNTVVFNCIVEPVETIDSSC